MHNSNTIFAKLPEINKQKEIILYLMNNVIHQVFKFISSRSIYYIKP
jgi:hypothetical protein